MGDEPTEIDVYLLATLERFASSYYPLFKCSYRRIAEFPAQSDFRERLRVIAGVSYVYNHTCTRDHFFRSVMQVGGEFRDMNPFRVVPADSFVNQVDVVDCLSLSA